MPFHQDPFSPKAAAKPDGSSAEPDDETSTPVEPEAPVEPEDNGGNEEEVPKGTVKELEEWVGDDKERAQRVLDAENADNEPRKSLVKAMEDLLAAE